MQNQLVKTIEAKGAWDLLEKDSNSCLVDVRTEPEWKFVGISDLSSIGKNVCLVSWRVYPDMEIASDFVEKVKKVTNDNKDAHILLLCKTGRRSYESACILSKEGFNNVYNINNGFEGDIDDDGHRGNLNGWKASGLKWKQG